MAGIRRSFTPSLGEDLVPPHPHALFASCLIRRRHSPLLHRLFSPARHVMRMPVGGGRDACLLLPMPAKTKSQTEKGGDDDVALEECMPFAGEHELQFEWQ